MFAEPSTLILFGTLSGILSAIAFFPYIKDTFRRRIAPDRASWLIWSTLGSIAFFSQVYEGATDSLWFAGVRVAGAIIVLMLSVRLSAGEFMSVKNRRILFIASCALIIWTYTETAAFALAITISISLLGGASTVQKAFQSPRSETMSTWVISLVASICAIFAVGKLDPILLAYPVYLFALHAAIVVAMLLGKLKETRAPQTYRVGIITP